MCQDKLNVLVEQVRKIRLFVTLDIVEKLIPFLL